MKKMLSIFLLLAAILTFAAEERDPSLLFYASFDSYTANPDFAKGHKRTSSVELRDLQLRMHSGPAGKGNALELSNKEFANYSAPQNFNPTKGSVSLWVSAKNWAPSKKVFQLFFRARISDGWNMYIYKFVNPGYMRVAIVYAGKEYAVNVPVKDADWTKGQWHHLVATWDESSLTFYMDGKKAKQLQYTKNPLIFKTAKKFPENISNCNFQLGTGGTAFSCDKDDRTALDEVKIYNRIISADEVRKEYERFFPPQTGAADRPVVTVPNGSAIKLDGKVDKKEWADASVVPVINLMQAGKQEYGPFTRFYMKQDAANYYFAAEVMEKAGRCTIQNDDNMYIWRDDCVELHLFSPQNKHYYQYIINPLGAVFDSMQKPKDTNIYSYVPGGNVSYNSKLKKAVFNGKDFWSVEIAIPKSSMKFGKDIWANFCRTSYGSKSYTTWAPGCERFFHMEKFGRLIMGGKAVRLEEFQFKGGESKVKFSGKNIFITDINRNKLNFVDGKLELPAGMFRLESKEKNWNYVFPFYIQKDFDFNYSCLPSKKHIEVALNLSSSPKAVRQQLAKGLPVTVTLEDSKGNILTQNKAAVKKVEQIVTLPLPQNPVRGIYNIRVAFAAGKEKVSALKKFRIPDMEPFINKVADDNTVPVPWTAIKQTNGKFVMFHRNFTFKKGPFPTAAAVDGKAVFKSAPAMVLNGKNIEWSAPVIKSNTGDRVIMEGTGKASGLAFRYRTELWFDGMVKTDIFMNGKNPINSLKMNWKVPAEYAKYLLTPLYNKWEGRDGEKYSLFNTNPKDFMIWTMGIEKGLCFHPQSQANFLNARNHKNYTLSRKGDTVSIDVDIISRTATLKKEAKYTFVFIPTPSKPFDPKWRNINKGDMWGYQNYETLKVNGYGVSKQVLPYDLEPWTGFVPANPAKFAKYAKDQIANGSSFMPYSQPCYVGEIEEAYDWFMPECELKPGHIAGGAWSHKLKRNYFSPGACGHTDIADLFVYRADKLLKDYPDLSGLYYDICTGNSCYNTRHGHGGVDGFGQHYLDSNLLSLREFFIRIYKVAKKHKKLLILHAHNRFSPFTHATADAWFPGEQYCGSVHENQKNFYCVGIPMREYQSAYSSQTHGCGIILFSQLRRQMWVYKGSPRLDDEPHTMMYLTPVMLHDINTSVVESKPDIIGKVWKIRHDMKIGDAVFHGYWFDKTYKVNAPNVYVSWYELKNAPYSRMIIVGNIGSTERTVKLQGIGNGKLYDLWNNNAPQNANSIKVGRENFRIFGLK